jgi:hypothetical protein
MVIMYFLQDKNLQISIYAVQSDPGECLLAWYNRFLVKYASEYFLYTQNGNLGIFFLNSLKIGNFVYLQDKNLQISISTVQSEPGECLLA